MKKFLGLGAFMSYQVLSDMYRKKNRQSQMMWNRIACKLPCNVFTHKRKFVPNS